MSRPGRTHQGRAVTPRRARADAGACGSRVAPPVLRSRPARGVQRSGPTSTATPTALHQPRRRGGDLGDGALERLGVARRRLRIAADLADVLAGGGLQFARRRRLIGATQGLDASAHARTVRHPAILGPVTAAEQIVEALGMRAHPEGGWYAETWRAARADRRQRPSGSAILYLLAPATDRTGTGSTPTRSGSTPAATRSSSGLGRGRCDDHDPPARSEVDGRLRASRPSSPQEPGRRRARSARGRWSAAS